MSSRCALTFAFVLALAGASGCGPDPATPAPGGRETATAVPATAGGAVEAPGDPPEATPPPATPVTEASGEARALAQRVCDILHTQPAERKAACCNTVPTNLAALCVDALAASLTAGGLSLDEAQVARCADETEKQLEGCGWVTPLNLPMTESCRQMLQGRLAAGAACRSAVECVDGLRCLGVTPSKEGVCGTPPPAGAPCSPPADNLAALTRMRDDPRHPVCEGRCIKGVCLEYVALGGACESSGGCVPGLNCVAGTCQDAPLSAAGQPCKATDCAEGTYCQDGTCAPLKGEGEPCKLPFECRGLTCAKEPEAALGKCGPPCGSMAPGGLSPE